MAYKRAFDDMFIKSAIHTVADVGLENTRTKDIAKYTGFTEATMFRAFPTKEILLQEAFLYIDKQISDIATQSDYMLHPDKTPFDLAIYAIWHKAYRYLIEHPEETLFLIRYRYSSLYTDEVQSRREAYNGNMDKVYALFERELGKTPEMNWQFLINSIFDLTLCFAEKVITGCLEDTEDTERSVWNIAENSIECAQKTAG